MSRPRKTLELPLSALGGAARVMASGVGDAAPVSADASVTGASVAPPSPVHPVLDGGTLRWTRRSRAGWRWLDRVDAPLGEERERYRVTVAGGGAVRELFVDAPAVALTAAELTGATISVRQQGSWAESAATTINTGG